MMWGDGFDWLSLTFMMLGSTLWIVLIVVIIWVVMRWLNQRTASTLTHTQPATSSTGMEILHQRYARGEIDAATFEQMQERLAPSNHNNNIQNRVGAQRPAGEQLFD